MNPNLIEERLKQITEPAYQDFIESGDTTEIAVILGSAHSLDEKALGALENAIDLYLLWLLDEAGLTTFISHQCDLSLDEAAILVAAIDVALPDDIRLAHQEPDHILSGITPTAIENDIVEAEAALAHVSTIRTMARDMEDLKSQAPHETPTYQSTQPTLERSSVPKNTIPPSPPRWGSS